MKRFILASIILISFEAEIHATKITAKNARQFDSTFKTKSFSEITHMIHDSILLNPELPHSWAGYSAARNILNNSNLSSDEKKEAIKMILDKAPTIKEQKRITMLLKRNI